MNINIDENLIAFAEKSAVLDNISVELWCERKLTGNIKRLMKDTAIAKIEGSKIEDLNTYTAAVEAVKAEIDAKIVPVIPVEEVIEEATTTPNP